MTIFYFQNVAKAAGTNAQKSGINLVNPNMSSNQITAFHQGTSNPPFSHSLSIPSTVLRQPMTIQHLPVKGKIKFILFSIQFSLHITGFL